ncbi:protein PsiE [Sutterella faecalis]|uniref:Protein PsiE n=2 Tax=Sutterella TaxID=40544 RepID=A0AAI9WN00_9BURK|nr:MULTISPECIES: phosphate-starvation-inducible PsiE family protein [Sutterella]KAB7651256.1 phosphate-starvation-inducible PsiE family protein [Sutterella seckii]QDA53638.1 protein PsiE [Sutterella faecalis]
MTASGSSSTPPANQPHRHADADTQLPEGPCRQCAFPTDPAAATSVESPKLTSASLVINLWLTYAQAAALIAIAIAAVGGIGQAAWEMIAARSISLGDLLMLFLYVEILSMVKGASLGTREIPIHTPIALAIVAVARYIVVDVEHINALTMASTAGAILLLVIALWILKKTLRSRDA